MTTPSHKLAFLILPDFSNLGLALAVEPLFVANWLAQKRLFQWSVLSVDGDPVRSSSGLPVAVDGALAEAGEPQTVVVVASFNVKQRAEDQRLVQWLRRMARFGAEMGALETGSEVLAAAGLLDGHAAAVHWDNLDGFRERYPRVRAEAQLYTLGRGRFTCAGATAILDLMLHWIAERGEAELAEEVAQHLLLPRRRSGAEEQGGAEVAGPLPASQAVRRAVALMQEAVEEALPLAEIARRVGLSQRQLQRQFRQHLGTTPTRHYTMIRLAKAHKLLQQTDLPVTEVAVSAGFASLENFSRVYRSVFGCPPSRDRRQSTCAPVFRQRGRAARREEALPPAPRSRPSERRPIPRR